MPAAAVGGGDKHPRGVLSPKHTAISSPAALIYGVVIAVHAATSEAHVGGKNMVGKHLKSAGVADD